MPNVSTYIRSDDLAKYLLIAKEKGAWSEFIHNALEDSNRPVRVVPKAGGAKHNWVQTKGELPLAPLGKNFMGVETKNTTVEFVDSIPPIKVCKIHGTPLDDRGRCMQKGCKYA